MALERDFLLLYILFFIFMKEGNILFNNELNILFTAIWHRTDMNSTYYGLCFTSCGAFAGTRNRLMVHQGGSIRQPGSP